jgi:hypothetical protein
MESKRCASCGESFHPRPQTPKQTYCSAPKCQRERRRRWQQARRQNDPDYRENQTQAQTAWAAQHLDYWREFRRRHPEYSERNRILQQYRVVRLRVPAGIYQLTPMTRDDLAKMPIFMCHFETSAHSAYWEQLQGRKSFERPYF